jgi:hypothetical protein
MLSPGELAILVTSVVGVIGNIANLWFTNAKTNRVSDDLVRTREQDRLDREQKAKELLDQQRHELEMARLKVEAAAAEVKHELMLSNKTADAQRQLMIESVRDQRQRMIENTDLTRQSVDKAERAYHEANTVNQKLEKIGLDSVEQQKLRAQQDQKIETVVVATEAKVDDVHKAVVVESSSK